MNLSTWLYRSALDGAVPMRSRISGRLRRLWLRFGDPDCVMEVHGRSLAMPMSHPLPVHRLRHPCYDTLPRRLARFLRDRDGRLTAIDVGANIGDSIAGFRMGHRDLVLAIEPAPGFVRFLRENWGNDSRVRIAELICCAEESPGQGELRMVENDGTARAVRSVGGKPCSPDAMSLDRIVEREAEFAEPNLLKIDTDGHDFEVLAGGRETVDRSKPAVFFECDAFDNAGYLDDCGAALARFRKLGYVGMLVYDNFGYLMGRFALDELGAFEQLLIYQVTSEFYYFDLLLIHDFRDLDAFHQKERAFFANRVGLPELERAFVPERSAALRECEALHAVELSS